ncbi:TPA: hypothetical protein ACJXXT_000213 [Pseudomonas aeruginosa]
MKRALLALSLSFISVQAHSAYYAYYPLENYKETIGHLPPGSIVFKPDPTVTPPDPVEPVDPVEPEPTEEEKKTDCYKKISEIVGDFGFNTDAAVKEYEDGTCAVDLSKIPLNPAYTRYLHEYVNMVIAFGNAGIMPSFTFTRNVDYTAAGNDTYPVQYNKMIGIIKTSEKYSNIFFTPTGNYKGTYNGYRIYTQATSKCVTSLKAYIDSGFSGLYYGSLNHTSCSGYWSELYQDVEFIKTTK